MDKQQIIQVLKEELGNPTFSGKEIPRVTERFWKEMENSSLEEVKKLYEQVIEQKKDI
jgi:S-ribosylhomocysteine lyase LuxS involved in autoinducer biosynthesis